MAKDREELDGLLSETYNMRFLLKETFAVIAERFYGLRLGDYVLITDEAAKKQERSGHGTVDGFLPRHALVRRGNDGLVEKILYEDIEKSLLGGV